MMIMIRVIITLFSVSTTSVLFASCPFSYPISLFVQAYHSYQYTLQHVPKYQVQHQAEIDMLSSDVLCYFL